MPRRNIYEMNFVRLEKILGHPPDALPNRHYRLKARGFMDLIVEKLPLCSVTEASVLSLAHYFEQNGDLCQDPEVVIRIFPQQPAGEAARFLHFAPSTDPTYGRVEALTFQQAIPPIYQEVYPEPGRYAPQLKRDLNRFLGGWLKNLIDQGHRLAATPDA